MQVKEDLHSPPPPYKHADSGEIKRDIRQTRSALDETIDSLTERLQPRRMAHEMLDRVIAKFETRSGELGEKAGLKAREVASSAGDSLKGVASSAGDSLIHAASSAGSKARVVGMRAGKGLGRSIKKNPLGFALIGAGIAYVLFSGKEDEDAWVELADGRVVRRVDVVRRPVSVSPDVDTLEYGEYGETYGPTYGATGNIPVGRPIQTSVSGTYQSSDSGMAGSSRLERAGDKASSAAHGIKSGARGAASSATHGIKSAGHGVKSAASSATHGIKSAGHGVKSAASSAAQGIKSAGHGVKSAASSASHGIKSAASSVGSAASSVGSSVGHGATQLAHNAREGYVWTLRNGRRQTQETPLLMGLGALALGIIVGALLPNTRREHRALGPMRDSLLDDARDLGQEVAEQGKQVARKTLDRATSEIYEQGLNPDQLASELDQVAGEIATSARDTLERHNLGDKVKRAARNTAETAVNEASEIKNAVSNKLQSKKGELPETKTYRSVEGGSTLGKTEPGIPGAGPSGTNLTSQATSAGPMTSRNIERSERSNLGSSELGTQRNPSAGNLPSSSTPSSGGNVAKTPGGALPEASPQRMSDLNRGSTRPTPVKTGGVTGRNLDEDESTIDPSTGNKKRSEGPIRDKRDKLD